MNFELKDEHKLIQKTARDFAVNELMPGVIERDKKKKRLCNKNNINLFISN